MALMAAGIAASVGWRRATFTFTTLLGAAACRRAMNAAGRLDLPRRRRRGCSVGPSAAPAHDLCGRQPARAAVCRRHAPGHGGGGAPERANCIHDLCFRRRKRVRETGTDVCHAGLPIRRDRTGRRVDRRAPQAHRFCGVSCVLQRTAGRQEKRKLHMQCKSRRAAPPDCRRHIRVRHGRGVLGRKIPRCARSPRNSLSVSAPNSLPVPAPLRLSPTPPAQTSPRRTQERCPIAQQAMRGRAANRPGPPMRRGRMQP